jgi:hypothetical protein
MTEHGDTIGPDEMDAEGKGPWIIQYAKSEELVRWLEGQGFVEVHSKTRVWGTARMMVKSLEVYP